MDLAYLDRFCKGDRTRMERYVEMYLKGSSTLYEDLKSKVAAADGEGAARAAHSLRPQVNYMGATPLVERLAELENMARTGNMTTCITALDDCLSMNARLVFELEAWLAGK